MSGAVSASSGSGSGGAPLPASEDLSQLMQFKLDNIPYLTDSARYRSWCSIAMLCLHSHSLWKIVNGSEPKPTNPVDLEKWEIHNITAQLFLTSMVDMSISHVVSDAPSAWDACQALQDRFDRRNPTTLYISVKSFFTSTSMAYNTTMLDHINGYENYLRQLVQGYKDISSDD